MSAGGRNPPNDRPPKRGKPYATIQHASGRLAWRRVHPVDHLCQHVRLRTQGLSRALVSGVGRHCAELRAERLLFGPSPGKPPDFSYQHKLLFPRRPDDFLRNLQLSRNPDCQTPVDRRGGGVDGGLCGARHGGREGLYPDRLRQRVAFSDGAPHRDQHDPGRKASAQARAFFWAFSTSPGFSARCSRPMFFR